MNRHAGRNLLWAAAAGLLFAGNAAALRLVHPVGVGTRAQGMANSYVALSSDFSAVYWNPAALAFLSVRELQVSADLLTQKSSSEFFDETRRESMLRPRVSQLGMLASVPTARGGLTFAGGFQYPWVFDDLSSYAATYSQSGQIHSVQTDYSTFGGLGLLSLAMGIQLARGVGLGVAVAPVVGRENATLETLDTVWGVDKEESVDGYTARYFGYDVRVGMLLSFVDDRVRAGLRLSVPRSVWFGEDHAVYDPANPSVLLETEQWSGRLLSSYEGAIGVAGVFPFATVSTELRSRAPYGIVYPNEDIPESAARHVRVGMSAGCEIPLVVVPLLLRFGYSWDEFDTHAFVVQYEHGQMEWGSDGITAYPDRHLFTLGAGYVVNNFNFECAWGYQLWGLTTQNTLTQNYSSQRIALSFSVRY